MKWLSRILKFLATGSLTILLAACYGTIQVMYGIPMKDLRGVIRTRRADATPLPGIKVSYRLVQQGIPVSETWTELGATDATGSIGYDVPALVIDSMDARLVDVDGPDNGGSFAEALVSVDSEDLTVTLQEIAP